MSESLKHLFEDVDDDLLGQLPGFLNQICQAPRVHIVHEHEDSTIIVVGFVVADDVLTFTQLH